MDAERIGRDVLMAVEREELVSLGEIRRLAQAYLISTDHQHADQRVQLERLLAEHYRRFETAEAKQRRQLPYVLEAAA